MESPTKTYVIKYLPKIDPNTAVVHRFKDIDNVNSVEVQVVIAVSADEAIKKFIQLKTNAHTVVGTIFSIYHSSDYIKGTKMEMIISQLMIQIQHYTEIDGDPGDFITENEKSLIELLVHHSNNSFSIEEMDPIP